MERSFFSWFIISIMIHLFATTILFAGQEEPKPEQFKELKIKLGIKKHKVTETAVSRAANNSQVAQAPSTENKMAQNGNSNRNVVHVAEQIPEILPAGAAKLNETEPAKVVSQEIDKQVKTTSMTNPQEVQPEKDVIAEKPDQQELARLAEQASERITGRKEEVAAQNRSALPPVPVMKVAALPEEGSILGNSLDKTAKDPLTYEQLLPLWMEKFKFYPEEAKGLGLNGRGVIRVTIKRDGKILYKEIEKSTGQPLLDRALVKMMEDADPVIPVPAGHHPEKKSLSYRMQFDLGE